MILSQLRSLKSDLVSVADAPSGVVVTKADGTTTLYTPLEWSDLSAALAVFNAAAKQAPAPV